MINPTVYTNYADYRTACKAENEIPADEKTWRGWCAPVIPAAPEIETATSPSTYLTWLVEQLPDLKFGGLEGDPVAEILWTVIREQRLQDERVRRIEQQLSKQEGDHK
jgi:hypothetical protein